MIRIRQVGSPTWATSKHAPKHGPKADTSFPSTPRRGLPLPGRGGAQPRGPLRLRGRASRAPSYEAPLRFAGRYRRAVTQCVRPRTALAGKQANVPLPPRPSDLEEKLTKPLNPLEQINHPNALAPVKTSIVVKTEAKKLAPVKTPIVKTEAKKLSPVKTFIAKAGAKKSLRAIRGQFDSSGRLSAAAKAKHLQWREVRREKMRLAKQAALLKLCDAPSSVADLEELGTQVVASLRAIEQREREVARRLYNRASAKLSVQRRTSYLTDLMAESRALETSLNLRLEQVELLRQLTGMAKRRRRA